MQILPHEASRLSDKTEKTGVETLEWFWKAWSDISREELYALLQLRQAVFVVEQDCAYLDTDGLDPDAFHLLGVQEGSLVAYARAFAPGRVYQEAAIGRVITKESIRGQGWGRPLMEEALRGVRGTWGPVPVKVSASIFPMIT